MKNLTLLQSVILRVADFYLQKNNGDIKKTNEEIDRLKIVKIELVDDDKVYFTTMRPGLFIGAVNTLEFHLGLHIHIIEEIDLNLLYSYDNDDSALDYEYEYNWEWELKDDLEEHNQI